MNDSHKASVDRLLACLADPNIDDIFYDVVWDILPTMGREYEPELAAHAVASLGDFTALDSLKVEQRVVRLLGVLVGIHNNTGVGQVREDILAASRRALIRWGLTEYRTNNLLRGFETPPNMRLVFLTPEEAAEAGILPAEEVK